MKTSADLWQYLAQFFLEWEMLDKSCSEQQDTQFMFNNFFPRTVGRHGTARLAMLWMLNNRLQTHT
jgi:hypothetical protein